MPKEQKSLVQDLVDLENRLKRKRANVATQRARLRERCARLLFEKCPDEMRRLVMQHVTGEEWKRFERLGFDDHLPSNEGNGTEGTTPNIDRVVPQPVIRDLFDHQDHVHE